ncbi:MAG: outer membrane lipoprotein-sorting protein [Deltaproteobacteria bacterium]|nr:MAG: outer membrane lipoprotein-sorting protein [Deltaproteobacteria bacterium]
MAAAIAAVACGATKAPVDARTSARAIIEDALAAKGGKAKLASLKAIRLTAAGTTSIGAQHLPVEVVRVLVFPDKLRIDATVTPPSAPRVVVSAAISGETGWQRSPDPKTHEGVSVDVTGSNLQTLKFERWREPEQILLKASDPAAILALAPDETIAGQACSVVKLQSPFGKVDVSLYIDKSTKLIRRMSYSDGIHTDNDDFADYRVVDGVRFAYRRTTHGGGRSTVFEVKTLEVDPEIDLTIFDKPAAN